LESETVKISLIDFGFATRVKKEELKYPRCGTPGFIAPEVAMGNGRAEIKSDIFSAGAVFFKLFEI
jgi:serine/threonine protein kinase